MSDMFRNLFANIRNIFSIAFYDKRFNDGQIQIKTVSGRLLKKKEAFPYGFYAKSKSGKSFVFCQGGDFSGFEIMPLIADDNINPPELNDGDAALYTESGGWITARENGTVELFGKNAGGLVKAKELENQLKKLTARVDGIINAINSAPVAPLDGGATFKSSICGVLASLVNKENFSNLESEKVLHGTGS